MTSTLTRHSWLWIAGPERFCDHAGRERPDVAPGLQVRGRHWWGCDRATRAGDRALLATLRADSQVAYVVEVLSDARAPRPWEAVDAGCIAVCDYVVVDRIVGPELGEHPEFVRWRTMSQVRRGGAFPVSHRVWVALVDQHPGD